MRREQRGVRAVIAAALLWAVTASVAEATTLRRMSLEELTQTNAVVVVGEVVDFHSYWNESGTFILTDVALVPQETLKGQSGSEEALTFTVMGGSVGGLSTIVLGGPSLTRERSYVVFLDSEDLPGAPARLTPRDLSQAVFEIGVAEGELKAVSQAWGQPLLPDRQGKSVAPGGEDGFELGAMIEQIHRLADQAAKEVSR